MRNKVKKSTIAIIALLVVLAAGVAVLAVLNGKEAAAKKQLRDDAVFLILDGRTQPETMLAKITMEEYLALNPVEFEANYKKSGKDPEKRSYTGVPFAAILELKGIDPAQFGSAVFAAADGYASAISIREALDESNCFIVADDGGDGPFRMVLPKDKFSQRWCKLLTDVHLR
ncbi:MAG: hypothetical protein FWC27_10965 [Firmicutes bacterium]|nr:hypothetical protein [Bacillota bacterium]